MPYTENSVLIRGDIKGIFHCVLELEKWPTFIPAIKHSKIIGAHEGKELHEMSSRICGIVSSWRSYLVETEHFRKIKYKQLKGLCNRMEGEWILEEQSKGVHVTLIHDFEYKLPVFSVFIEPIIERYVIAISNKILEGIKSKIEHEN